MKRYIFTWKDELEEARIKAMAKDAGVTVSKMIHHLLAQTPVIGTVNSETGKVRLVTQADIPDREYVGNDTGRE